MISVKTCFAAPGKRSWQKQAKRSWKMSQTKLGQCKRCGSSFPREELSKRGLCRGCREKAVNRAIRQMRRKRGPTFEKWLEHHPFSATIKRRLKGGK